VLQSGKRENDTNELSVRSEVLKKIDRIASIRIPNDKEELFHLLSELSIHIKATKLSANDDDENRTRNQYYEALCEKYRQSIFKLESISPNDPQINYYKNILSKQPNDSIESSNNKNTENAKDSGSTKVIFKILFFLLICVALFFLTARYIKQILMVLCIAVAVVVVIFIIMKLIKRK